MKRWWTIRAPFALLVLLSDGAFPATSHAADIVQAGIPSVQTISGSKYFVVQVKSQQGTTVTYQLSPDLLTWRAPGSGGAPAIVETAVPGDPAAKSMRIDSPITNGSRYFLRAIATAPKRPAMLDFDGDGKTDWVVIHYNGGQTSWVIRYQTGGTETIVHGKSIDFFVPGDYDGDGKCDAAVWNATDGFRIRQSSNGTIRTVALGTADDNPSVMADYDGDGKSDPAVYSSTSTTSTISYRSSLTGNLGTLTITGVSSFFPNPGDYDGDGKADICVQGSSGSGGTGKFSLVRSSDGGSESVIFGQATDSIVRADYDGDGKADFVTVRGSGNAIHWSVLERDGGGTGNSPVAFGSFSTDFITPGDYDSDGKTDLCVWNSSNATFQVRRSSDLQIVTQIWGTTGDFPVASVYKH